MGVVLFSKAQPTLTNAGVVGVPGDVIVYNYYGNDSINSGLAGADQHWSISFPNHISLLYDSIVAPSATANYSVFSATSNVVEHVPGYGNYYYHADSTVYQCVGEKTGSEIIFSDPKDYLRFPLNYGDSYTDTWNSHLSYYTPYDNITGTTTVTYDGFGTLATPDGTVHNVARIHVHDLYDENNNNSMERHQADQYFWYQEGSHSYLATVYINHELIKTHYTWYWATYRTDMKALAVQGPPAPEIAVELYPNPATDHVQIKVPASASILKAELYSPTGALAETIVMQDHHLSGGVYEFDTRHLAPGLYSVRLISSGHDLFEMKKLLVSQN